VSLEFHTGDTEADMDTKSPDAFRTISEVAEDLDIPQHVLRFWETRFPQIKPLKRGGGRRYYRPDDVALLKGIRRLLYGEGYTIKGLQRILKEQGPRHVQAIGRGAPIGAPPDAAKARDGAAAHPAPPGRAPVPPGLDDITLLTAVLAELGECKRILDRALQPPAELA
jgi:DNA-binding transcriptional MerR regulator